MTRITRRALFVTASLIAVAGLVGINATDAQAASKLGSGSFKGKSGHVTKGTVTVEKTSKGYRVRLAKNFFLDGAPDPWLGFGKNGRFVKKTRFSVLRKNKGAQTYVIPASLKAESYNQVFVWCKKFSVPLGVATFK